MKIVFLGDSITDAGRNCNNGSLVSIGQGYPLIVDAYLSTAYPGRFSFVNSGISGSRSVDVLAQLKAGCWNQSPDIVSILLGVNDVWHELDQNNGVDAERFYRIYRMMAEDTQNRLFGVKLMLMEPFVLKGSVTSSRWDTFYGEVRLRAEAVKKIAQECTAIYVPLQSAFEDACKTCPPAYWLGDGVHPTPAGHQLIANAWLEQFKKAII